MLILHDRFFWLALYAQPALWVGLAIFAIVRLENVIWLSLVGELRIFFLSYFSTMQRAQVAGHPQLYNYNGTRPICTICLYAYRTTY